MIARSLFIASALVVSCTAVVFSQDPLIFKTGRIAISHDGNAWDLDAAYALAMDWAVLAAFGVQEKLVHNEHSILGPKCNSAQHYAEMVKSAQGWQHFPGFDSSVVFDAWADINATVAHFKVAAEKSSENDTLYYLLCYSYEVPWRNLNAVSLEKRKYIVCIRSSFYSELPHSCITGEHTSLSEFRKDGVVFRDMRDQNQYLGGGGSIRWNFLSTIPENAAIPASAWQWLKRRDAKMNGDCSDNGQLWFLLTGNMNATPADYEIRFKNPLSTNVMIHRAEAPAQSNNHFSVRIDQANGMLNIKANGVKGNGPISIYTMSGKAVARATMTAGQATFARGKIPAGRYIAAIEINGRTVSKEIVLK